jgi:CDP-diacylglycerol---glycerol-3-phosphate 3-phosphatidyltransferase
MNVIPQFIKDGFVALTGPVARALIRIGVHPNTITTVGTLVVIGSGVAFGYGAIRTGGVLLLLSGVFDILDGQVARQGGKMTTFGAFYDSTLDRLGEGAVFTGLIFFFLTGPLPGELKVRAVGVALIALVASLLVSYTRARAEALGVECKVGIAARAERILLLGLPALVFGAGPPPWRPGVLLFSIVVVLAVVSAITVVQRVVHVARVARGAPPPSLVPKRETLPGVAAMRRKAQ